MCENNQLMTEKQREDEHKADFSSDLKALIKAFFKNIISGLRG